MPWSNYLEESRSKQRPQHTTDKNLITVENYVKHGNVDKRYLHCLILFKNVRSFSPKFYSFDSCRKIFSQNKGLNMNAEEENRAL